MSRIHKIYDGGKEIEMVCSGSQDCRLCMRERDQKIKNYLSSIPFPIEYKQVKVKVRKKDGRIVKKLKDKLVVPEGVPEEIIGKTIKYICEVWCDFEYSPCFKCMKNECNDWQRIDEFKGRDPGCPHQMTLLCLEFTCPKGIVDPLQRG